MKTLQTLLWLEFKKSAWLLVGMLLFFCLIVPLIARIPESAARPTATAAATAPPDAGCPDGDCQDEPGVIEEEDDGPFAFSWSGNLDWSSNTGGSASSGSTGDDVEGLSNQIDIRGRQFAVLFVCGMLGSLLLLGFLVIHYRESESGEIALLYQAPISGDLQLWIRFGFMVVAVGALLDIVIGSYWGLQRWQGLDFFGPMVGGFGYEYQLDWINVMLIGMTLFVLPISAFILLFCQVQNAYGLLNRRRLSGVVLIIASIQAILLSMSWVIRRWSESPISIRIIHVRTRAGVGAANPADPENFLFQAPVEVLLVSLFMAVLMMVLAGRVWKEVEWS